LGVDGLAAELGAHYSNTYQHGAHTFEGEQVGRLHYRVGLHALIAKPAWVLGGVELSHPVPVVGEPAFGGFLGAALF
jgi:hypothetical protein